MDPVPPRGNAAGGAQEDPAGGAGNLGQGRAFARAVDAAKAERVANVETDNAEPDRKKQRRGNLKLGTLEKAPRRGALPQSPFEQRAEMPSLATHAALKAAAKSESGEGDSWVDVMCSVRDGKIGSIYSDDGRVRMTHFAGPAQSKLGAENILRFNINTQNSWNEFLSENRETIARIQRDVQESEPPLSGDAQRRAIANQTLDARDQWIATELASNAGNEDDIPYWAQAVDNTEDLEDFRSATLPEGEVLFEVYNRGPDRPPKWHVSRGIAAKMTVSQTTVDAINDAIKSIEGITDPKVRNEKFYNFMGSHAPELTMVIRRPEEIE